MKTVLPFPPAATRGGELFDHRQVHRKRHGSSVALPITQQADIDDEDDTEDGTEDSDASGRQAPLTKNPTQRIRRTNSLLLKSPLFSLVAYSSPAISEMYHIFRYHAR